MAGKTRKKRKTSYCEGCDAKCCRYFTVPLERPEDRDDFDAMQWYILHQGVSIYIDDEGDWHVNIVSRCRALDRDNLCRVYDARPDICRDHDHDVCEGSGDPYDFREHFQTRDELRAYARKFLARQSAIRRRRSRAAKEAWRRRKACAAAGGEGRPSAVKSAPGGRDRS